MSERLRYADSGCWSTFVITILAVVVGFVVYLVAGILSPARSQETPLTADTTVAVFVWCENVSPFWNPDGEPSEEQKRLMHGHEAVFLGNCLNVESLREMDHRTVDAAEVEAKVDLGL
jgi:hypothetical protein